MTKEEFKNIIKAVNEVYGADTISSSYSMELWFALLKDLPYETANKALLKYMQTSSYKPKPSDIRKAATEVQVGYQESGNEVWQRIDNIVRSLPIGMAEARDIAESRFRELPVPAQRLLGNSARLVEMAAEYTLRDYETARLSFVRDYRAEESQNNEYLSMSPAIQSLIGKGAPDRQQIEAKTAPLIEDQNKSENSAPDAVREMVKGLEKRLGYG